MGFFDLEMQRLILHCLSAISGLESREGTRAPGAKLYFAIQCEVENAPAFIIFCSLLQAFYVREGAKTINNLP